MRVAQEGWLRKKFQVSWEVHTAKVAGEEQVTWLSLSLLIALIKTRTSIVLSLLPLKRVCPSGLKPIDKTQSECLNKVPINDPVLSFHILAVLSLLPLIRVCPSGLIAIVRRFVCPDRVRNSSPLWRFHTLIVLSQLPLARVSIRTEQF